MRISEWSSDVWSSDLPVKRSARTDGGGPGNRRGAGLSTGGAQGRPVLVLPGLRHCRGAREPAAAQSRADRQRWNIHSAVGADRLVVGCQGDEPGIGAGAPPARSDAPTSELQSLMRNPYDVFCLKKK